MGAIDRWLDLVLLLVVLVIGIALLPTLFIEYGQPIVSYTEDKTALDVENALYPGDTVKTGADLLMGLVVTDEYSPFPKSIKINDSSVIQINKNWVADKYSNISRIYSTSGEYQLGAMLEWQIASITYVDDSESPYLHYILEER